jgi:hypothetical protein
MNRAISTYKSLFSDQPITLDQLSTALQQLEMINNYFEAKTPEQ